MLWKLLLLFVVVPLVELALLLILADWTDWRFTLLLVIATGVVGSLLARWQGWQTFFHIQRQLAAGRLPGESLLDAVLIFLAGALLLTPGILTDALGLSLLLPPCRRIYRSWLIGWFHKRFRVRQFYGVPDDQKTPPRKDVIDSYVVDPDEDAKD